MAGFTRLCKEAACRVKAPSEPLRVLLLLHLSSAETASQVEISQGEDQQIEPRVPLADTCLLVRIV